MKDWQKAEVELCNLLSDVFQCGGVIETDLEKQFKDIDVTDRMGNTYSVKYQPSSTKTGNFAFEYLQENPANGNTMDGSFKSCEADRYAIFRQFGDAEWCFMCESAPLKEFVNNGDWKSRTTRRTTEENNNYAVYSRGHCYLVPVKELYKQYWITVFIKKNNKWVIHNKKKVN